MTTDVTKIEAMARAMEPWAWSPTPPSGMPRYDADTDRQKGQTREKALWQAKAALAAAQASDNEAPEKPEIPFDEVARAVADILARHGEEGASATGPILAAYVMHLMGRDSDAPSRTLRMALNAAADPEARDIILEVLRASPDTGSAIVTIWGRWGMHKPVTKLYAAANSLEADGLVKHEFGFSGPEHGSRPIRILRLTERGWGTVGASGRDA